MRTVTNMPFIGGDTQTFEYDFYTKVANSTTDCPLEIYEADIDPNNIPIPTDAAWTKITDQTKIDRLKEQNNVPISTSVNASTYTINYNGVDYDDNTYQVFDDFKGKVSGSTTENPHKSARCYTATLSAPTNYNTDSYLGFLEIADYNDFISLNNACYTPNTVQNTRIPQQLFSFNLIRMVEDKYGLIPAVDKVQWLKDNVVLNAHWYGYGSCPSGNKACFAWWINALNIWTGYPATHSYASVTQLNSALDWGNMKNYIDTNGFVHFLAYTDASDGVTASTIYTDYISLELQLKCVNRYTTNPINSDFVGKVSGSVTENPNIFRFTTVSSGLVPATQLNTDSSLGWYEDYAQADIDKIKTLDNNSLSSTRTTNGQIPQQLFSFNLIAIYEKTYGTITATDKVAWLKANINKIVCNWTGYGTCPSGNFAQLEVFHNVNNIWNGAATNSAHNSPTPYKITGDAFSINYIDSNGFIHYLAHTNASDGVTASTIYTDYVQISITMNSNRLLTPVNNRRDGTKGDILMVNDQTLSVSKYFDGATLGLFCNVINKAKAMLIELDLTAVCNALYGGSNTSMESALKKIEVDVWAKGTASNGGALVNSCKVQQWAHTGSTWSTVGSYPGSYTISTASSIAKMIAGLPTQADCAWFVNSLNKFYTVVYSTYPSDGTIPSTLDLDYVNIKVDFGRTVDAIAPIPVTLGSEWSVVVKGYSPYITAKTSTIFTLGTDINNYFSFYMNSAYTLKIWEAVGGTNTASADVTTISTNWKVVNAAIVKKNTTITAYVLLNNGTIVTATMPTQNKSGNSNISIGQKINNTGNTDAFVQSLSLFNKALTADETTVLLKGRNTVDSNNVYLNNLALKFQNPNLVPLFSSSQWGKHAKATVSSDGKTLTLNADAAWEFNTLYLPVLPNNQYNLKFDSTNNGYMVIEEYANNTLIKSTSSGALRDISITTTAKTNKIKLRTSNADIGTYTWTNVSLRRLD